MVCRHCKKTISLIHRLVDKEFCCKQHRNAFTAHSVRALREMGEFTYSAADVLRETDEFAIPAAAQASGPRSTATVLGLAALTIAGLVVLEKSGVGSAPLAKSSGGDWQPSAITRFMGTIADRIPKSAVGGIQIEDRFQTGLRNWLPAPGTGLGGGRMDNGLMRPGGLRIWDESRNLADYRFQFEGRIENKAIGWVVRAPNHNNYYAVKLLVPDGGNGRPEIVRFSMIQGQESRRQHFPLPVQMDKGAFYDYEVRAAGDRILTIVGGRVVDQWRDARFRTGGVGFFSEHGDRASIRWAKLQEGEGVADRVRSFLTFGMILPMP